MTLNNEIFEKKRYTEQEYYNDTSRGVLTEPVYCYSGFMEYGSNSIVIKYNSVIEVKVSNGYNRTEWLFYSSDQLPSIFYRELKEGEKVDSRLRPIEEPEHIIFLDTAGRAYECDYDAELIKPVTFEMEKDGIKAEVDGFLVGDNFTYIEHESGSDGMAITPFSWNVYLGKVENTSNIIVGAPSSIGVEPDTSVSIVSYDKFYHAGKPTSGIWIAKESVEDATYRERDLKDGEMEITYGTNLEEVDAIKLQIVNEILGTNAQAESVKKVLFKKDKGDDSGEYTEIEGYLFPESAYVGLAEEIFANGNYTEGYHTTANNGILSKAWYSSYDLLNAEGMLSADRLRTEVAHIQVIHPTTNETAAFYFAADTIAES